MEAHPYGFILLSIIFCLTNIALLYLKIIGRIKADSEKIPERIQNYIILAFFGSVLLGFLGTYKTYENRWVFFLPIDGLLLGLCVFLLYLHRVNNPVYQNHVPNLLMQPKSGSELEVKSFLKNSATRDFFILLATIASISIVFYTNPAGISRSQKVIILNNLLLVSMPFLVALVIFYFLTGAKNIEWFKITFTKPM